MSEYRVGIFLTGVTVWRPGQLLAISTTRVGGIASLPALKFYRDGEIIPGHRAIDWMPPDVVALEAAVRDGGPVEPLLDRLAELGFAVAEEMTRRG